MKVKCTFCNDTKQEPGIPGPCVWCEQVGAAPVAVGYQFAKGFTDPVGDCEKFEAGITVNAWLQRIVVYGDSPSDAEALRDQIMSSAEREAALREELAKFKAGCVDLSSQVRELEHKMDYYKGEGLRADALQQRLTVAEQLMQEFCDRVDRGEVRSKATYAKFKAALKPAAECVDLRMGSGLAVISNPPTATGIPAFAYCSAALKPAADAKSSPPCPNCKVCMGSPDFPENCLINGVKP